MFCNHLRAVCPTPLEYLNLEYLKVSVNYILMEYVKPFLIGGGVIAGSKFVSKFASPALSPIIGGMPTGIIAALFLNSQASKREYFNGYFYSSILLALAIAFIHFASTKYTHWNVDVISGIAIVIWAILSYFAINFFIPAKNF